MKFWPALLDCIFVMVFLLSWSAMLIGSTALERISSLPTPIIAKSMRGELFRLTVFTLIFLFFFSWSWRPMFSAFATWIFVGIFAGVCRGKIWFVHEPLVFSDMAFILDILNYPKLFYTNFLKPIYLFLVVALLLGMITAWFVFEPHVLPTSGAHASIITLASLWILVITGPFMPGIRRLYEAWALAITAEPDLENDIINYGHLATLVIHFIAWRGDDRQKRIARFPAKPQFVTDQNQEGHADLIVIAQCESFYDLRRLGMDDISFPHLDAARARAVSWGQLGSSFEGGYTLRTEFAFLTGHDSADLGFDRYYPYLRAHAYAGIALPNALKRLGYETVFMHPFYRKFFFRHNAMPAIGFDKIIMLDEFEGAPIKGEHVSDDAVADRLIAEARAANGPAFLFAATMENHGPWEADRFEGAQSPLDVYKVHLSSGDDMLGRLIATFEDWPGRVVLVFYGDHVPVLKSFADPFPDVLTDYVLLELGRDAEPARKPRNEIRTIAALTWDAMDLAGVIKPR